MAALAADPDPVRQRVGNALRDAAVTTAPVADRMVNASIAVPAGHLSWLREQSDVIASEFGAQLQHHGWTLASLGFVANDPASAQSTTPAKKAELVSSLADAIAAQVKSYDVAELCDRLGMPEHPDPEADPFKSKRVYVSSRLQRAEPDKIVAAARRFLEDFEDDSLGGLLERYRPGGPGEVKNLVFGSTRKPDLVLTDALSNDLALLNAEDALLYDGGIPDEGLSWRALVTFILPDEAADDLVAAARKLHARLRSCLASDPERHLFHVYAQRYRALGFDQPALVPQVWLHYDPKASWQRDRPTPITRQRMDFLLLLPGRRRVVLEVDGKQHYADNTGRASPSRYAEMARADRELRLGGYEVFRFGGAELPDLPTAEDVLSPFFDELLRRR
jgi:very-short-patch-repair endonuclease